MTPLRTILKHPTALAPPLISLAAIGTIVAQLVRFGAAPQPDETGYAHLWQLLMALDAAAVVVFAVRWIPAAPRPAAAVLALQLLAIALAAAPVALLGW